MRLIAKTEEVVVKDMEIQEKDKLHKALLFLGGFLFGRDGKYFGRVVFGRCLAGFLGETWRCFGRRKESSIASYFLGMLNTFWSES